MGKRPSSKRDEAAKKASAEAPAGDAEFKLPDFDEKAFMRREVETARTTFWTTAVAIPVGLLAWVVARFGGTWWYGWLPVVAAMLLLGPVLKRAGYSEESTAAKAMFGNWFLLFFTALSVWILATNVA